MDKERAKRIASNSARQAMAKRAQRKAVVDASVARKKLAEQGVGEDQYKYYREMDIDSEQKRLEDLQRKQEMFKGFETLVGSGGTLDTPIYDGDTPIYFKDYFSDYDQSLDLSTMEGRKKAITPYDYSSEIYELGKSLDIARLAQSVNLDAKADFSQFSAPNDQAAKALQKERRDSYMTPEEKNRYYYLYNTQGAKAAESYMRALQNDLYSRGMKKVEDFVGDNWAVGAVAPIGSVLTSLLSGIEGVANMAGYAADKYIGLNENAEMRKGYLSDVTQVLRGGVSKDYSGAGKFFYDTTMSGVDSLVASLIPGGHLLLGASAASQATNDILTRGGTNDQALIGGVAAGIFESFFENYSIEALNSMQLDEITTSFKAFTKNIGKQMLTNAQEEMATEAANIVFDTVAMGDISNYALMVGQYMDEGMSESEAIAKAAGLFGLQIAEAGASGALIGGAFGVGGAGVGALARAKQGRSIVNDSGTRLNDLIEAGEATFAGDKYKGERELLEAVKANKSKNDVAQRNRVQKLDELLTKEAAERAKTAPSWAEQQKAIREAALKDVTGAVGKARGEAENAKIGKDITYTHMPSIANFSGAEGGNIYVEKSDGTTAKLSDLAVEDEELYEAYSLATSTGSVENANAFIQNYRLHGNNVPVEEFWTAWMGAQNYGQTVTSEGAMEKAVAKYGASNIPEAALQAAFLSGRKLRSSASEKFKADQAKYEKAWKEAGGKVTASKFDDSALRGKSLDNTQQEYRSFLRVFSRATGTNIEVFASEKGARKENGSYNRDSNTLRIDINAGISNKANYNALHSSLINTLSHETVHNMRVTASKQYEKLRDFVTEKLQEDEGYNLDAAIEAEIEKYKQKGEDITREDAIEEIVARACEDRLGSSEALRDFLIDFYAKDKDAANGFIKAVREFIARLKTFFENIAKQKSNAEEARLIAEKGADIVAEIQKLFDEAVLAMREGNTARNAVDSKVNTDIVNTMLAERYQAADYNIDILSMVENVSNGNFKANDKIGLGTVTDTTAAEITKLTGIDVKGFKIAIEARQIEHILKDHGKNGMTDRSMSNPSDIAKIEYALKNYDVISLAGKTQAYTHMVKGRNRTVDTVIYEKSIGEKSYYVVQAVPDTKAKTLYVVTAFIGKKGYKKEDSQLINAKSPDVTAKTGSVNPSDGSISQHQRTVNRENENNKILYQNRDAEYLDAVKRGDTETAQRLVDEAARAAGYTDKLYHGTKKFGFTEFDPSYSDDKISIFAASTDKLAQTYSGRSGVKRISSIANVDTMSIDNVVKNLSKESKISYAGAELKTEYELLNKENVQKIFTDVDSGIESLQGDIEKKIKQYADKMALDFNDKDEKIHRNLVRLNNMLEYYEYDSISTPLYMLINHTDALSDIDGVAELEYKIRLRNKLSRVSTDNGVVVEKDFDGDSISVLSFDEARIALKDRLSEGNYALYGKPINQLVINGNGRNWNDIRNWTKAVHYTKENTDIEKKGDYWRLYDKAGNEIFHGRIAINDNNKNLDEAQMHYVSVLKANNNLDIRAEYMHTTREIAKFAKERGYESVKFENIVDNGGMGESTGAGDVYAYFVPANLKSADPVTYDDNGNVIPLSERFNERNPDIRYQDRDEQARYSLKDAVIPTREELEAKPPIAVVDLSKPKTHGTFAERRRKILDSIDDIISRPYLNEDTKTLIFLTKKSYTHIFSNQGEMQLTAAENLPEFIKNAVLTYVEDASHGDTHADLVYTLFSAAKYENRVLPVKLKVKEYKYTGQKIPQNISEYFNNAPKDYASSYDTVVLEVEEIEKSPTGSVKNVNEFTRLNPTELSDISIADLLALVKGESKKYIPDYEKTSELYQDRIETPEPSEVLRKYFAGNETYEGYKPYVESLKKYRDLMERVENFEKKIEEIDKNIVRLRKAHRQIGKGTRMDDLHKQRQRAEERIKELRNRMFAMEAKELRMVVNAETKQAITEIRQKYAARSKERRENASKRQYIESIGKRTKAISELFAKNNAEKHIPDELKAPIADLITALDFSSKRSLSGGDMTQKEEKLKAAVKRITELSALTNGQGLPVLDLPPRFQKEWDAVKEAISVHTWGKGTMYPSQMILENMNSSDLRWLNRSLMDIQHAINVANDVISMANSAPISVLSKDLVKYLDDEVRQRKAQSDNLWQDTKNLFVWENTLPVYAFDRLGGTGRILFESFQNGFDQLVGEVNQIKEYTESAYKFKEVKEWRKQVYEFDCVTLSGKERKIYLTVPQIMSFYCLSKREHAMPHFKGGGIVSEDIKAGKEKYKNDANGVRLTDETIVKILSTLTERQREVADKLQSFLNTECSAWGNEVSMKRYGIRMFTEQNYFPIRTKGSERDISETNAPQNTKMYALLNMSFSKPLTELAKNQIVISDIFEVFADHSNSMARYHSLALPVLDYMKVYNYREKIKSGDETDTSYEQKNVRDSVKNAYGDAGLEYFEQFITGINGANWTQDSNKLSAALTKSAKTAMVGFNLRTVVQQPTSAVRALMYLDLGDMVFSLNPAQIKKGHELALQYCPMAKWKSMGYFDIGTGRGMESMLVGDETWKDKTVEASMYMAGKADELTLAYLWNACERWVSKNDKSLTKNTDTYYNSVGKKLREVIYKTQVVDSPLTRSKFMNSPSEFNKMLAMFGAEPTVTYNMALDVAYKIASAKSRKQAWGEQRRQLAGFIGIYATQALLLAAVQSAMDAIRDDDDEPYSDKYMDEFWTNLLAELNPLNKLPILRDIVSVLEGYAASRIDTTLWSKLSYLFKDVEKLIKGKDVTLYKWVYDILSAASTATGVAASNLVRDIVALWNTIIGSFFPHLKIKK